MASTARAPAAFDRERWWTGAYRMVQTNLREIDVGQQPRDIARAVREFGANVIVSNIGGIVAFYPTGLELQYTNPYLSGDFVAEMIEAAHAEGLAYIGRFDLSKATRVAFDARPEWFMRNRDGGPREYEGTYQACPNGDWARQYGKEILAEALQRYAPDGLFFNMTGYPQTDYANVNHGICVCDNCRRSFRATYGLELPRTEGFADPNWVSYLEFQWRTSEALNADTRRFVASLRPHAPVLGFYSFDSVGRGEVQRRVHRRAPEWAYQAGEQSRWAQAREPGKAFSATSAAHIDYPWRQVTETAAYHELRFAQLLATGARLDLYLMGTLDDQDDPGYLEPIARLFRWHAGNEQHYRGLSSGARVALYSSESTTRYGGATPWARYVTGALRGAYSALVDSRLPFDFVSGERVEDGTTQLAGAYDAIVLPHAMLLTDAEAAELDRYVESGGLLIATGMTGGYDDRGNERPRSAMACSPVAAFGAPVDAHGWCVDGSQGALAGVVANRIAVDGHYFRGELRDGAVKLLPFARDQRFGPPEFSYANARMPPRIDPAVLLLEYGKGHAIHIPWLPDWQYYRDGLPAHQRLIAALIARFSAPPRYQLEGAGAVEMTVQRQRATGRTLVHIVNYAGQRNGRYDEPPRLHELRLGISTTNGLTARALVAGSTLPVTDRTHDGACQWLDLPPVGAFEAVLLEEADG